MPEGPVGEGEPDLVAFVLMSRSIVREWPEDSYGQKGRTGMCSALSRESQITRTRLRRPGLASPRTGLRRERTLVRGLG